MIIQTFSLEDLRKGKAVVVTDPYEQFKAMSYREQLDHILSVHHEKERALMREIDDLLKPLAGLGEEAPLSEFIRTFHVARRKLEDHFEKEEKSVFPLMYAHDTFDLETVDAVNSMTNEHREQEKIIESLQMNMDLFEKAEYEPIRKKLEEFYVDLSMHISKEDEITFPNYIDFVIG